MTRKYICVVVSQRWWLTWSNDHSCKHFPLRHLERRGTGGFPTPPFVFEITCYTVVMFCTGWPGICYVGQDGLQPLLIFLPLLPQCCNYRHVSPHLLDVLYASGCEGWVTFDPVLFFSCFVLSARGPCMWSWASLVHQSSEDLGSLPRCPGEPHAGLKKKLPRPSSIIVHLEQNPQWPWKFNTSFKDTFKF